MSISTAGRARRKFIAGIRLWPPARNLASSPCSAFSDKRLLQRRGGDVFEGSRLHDARCGERHHAIALANDAACKVSAGRCGASQKPARSNHAEICMRNGSRMSVLIILSACANIERATCSSFCQYSLTWHRQSRACQPVSEPTIQRIARTSNVRHSGRPVRMNDRGCHPGRVRAAAAGGRCPQCFADVRDRATARSMRCRTSACRSPRASSSPSSVRPAAARPRCCA